MNYKKSSDYLDEHFLLCQKHYDERFFLTRSKLKGKWRKSDDGSIHEIKIEYGKAKYDKFGKPIESHTERQEVADKVFLVSTFNADTNQYEITVENGREEPLTFSMDFSGSENMKMVDGSPMSTFLAAEGKSTSDIIYLQKENPDLDHEMALDFFVHAKKDLSVNKWKNYNQMLRDGIYNVEERVEIADNVYLHSKFAVYNPQSFEFRIENLREEPLVIDCIYSGSVNLRIDPQNDSNPTSHVFNVDGKGAFSDTMTLVKVDKEAAHEIHMSFSIRDNTNRADGNEENASNAAKKAENGLSSLSLEENGTKNSSSNGNRNSPPKTPVMSAGIASRAASFNTSSGYIPSPMQQKDGTADECEVRYYGAQRLTMVSKLKHIIHSNSSGELLN